MTGDPTQDDAFASLFRPGDAAQPPVQEASPAAPTGTGRLFRSTAVDDGTDAIPALRADQARRLRTVGAAAAPIVVTGTAMPSPITPEPVGAEDRSPAPDSRKERRQRKERGMDIARGPRERGLPPLALYLVVIVVSLAFGFIDALLGGGLGLIWGIGLLLSSTYAAFAARAGDGTYAVTAPAIAAFVGSVTVAQIGLGASGESLFDRAVVAFFALGDNWAWIIGSTLLALAIVLVKGRLRRS